MVFDIKSKILVKIQLKEPRIKLDNLIDLVKFSADVVSLNGYQDVINLYDEIKPISSNVISNILEVRFNINIEVETSKDLIKNKNEVLELSKKITSECILFNNSRFEYDLLEANYPAENIENLHDIKTEVNNYSIVLPNEIVAMDTQGKFALTLQLLDCEPLKSQDFNSLNELFFLIKRDV